jgi:RNA polymerase sigma-70 factor (ECF subfamily)
LLNDRKRRLTASIQLLPVPQRQAITLCLEGFSYGEMAVILGISANAVMLRCRRARAELQAIME